MGKKEDFDYAMNVTRIVMAPQSTIETFGTTTVNYMLISELMDQVNTVRVREGKMYSERPQIITPNNFENVLLDGFGEQAEKYLEWLREHGGDLPTVIRYGLQFRHDSKTEELINDTIDTVAERLSTHVRERSDPLSALIIGADELWEVSLIKFMMDYVGKSASSNLQDFSRMSGPGRSVSIDQEIEADFAAATKDRSRLQALGDKLQEHRIFDKYEDRFYRLLGR